MLQYVDMHATKQLWCACLSTDSVYVSIVIPRTQNKGRTLF